MDKKVNLFGLVGATLITGVAIGMTTGAAMAQQVPSSQETVVAEAREYRHSVPEVEPLPTIPEEFNDAFYSHVGNYFHNWGILPSLRLIFGIPSYVENGIAQDGRSVNRLYKEVLEQQTSSDPVLRSPDLPNPYTGSILTTPLVITEEPIAPMPPFPSVRRPRYAEPAPSAPSHSQDRQREQPVPGLW